MDWLRARAGDGTSRRLDVDGELVMGRGQPGLGAVADDVEMSRRHARFTAGDEGNLTVEDLGSANGTFVNGRRISGPTALRPGDVIQLGATELEVIGDSATRVRAVPKLPDPDDPDITRVRKQPPARPAEPPPPPRPAEPPPPTRPAERAPVPAPPRPAEPVPAAARRPAQPAPVAAPAASGQPASTPFSSAAPARGRDSRVAVLGVLLVLAIGGLIASLALGGGGGDDAAASTEAPYDGTVYALTNRVQPMRNSVVAFRYGENGFEPTHMREYATGGSGSTLVGENKEVPVAVDGDQQLQVDRKRKLLFAVNQGSDTIAVFRIAEDGGLTPVAGSPFASRGRGPISIGLSEDTVVVVNKGLDGQRKINDPGTIAQFQLTDDGKLTPIGESVKLTAGAGPAQAFVIDRADIVLVPQLVSGGYRSMVRGAQGTFAGGPMTNVTDKQRALGIPLREALVAIAPPGTRIPERLPTPPQGAQGMSVHPEQDVVYSELPPFSLLMVHTFDRSGNMRFVRGVQIQGGLLACWSKVSPDGNTLYVSNAGTHTVGVFNLADPQKPQQIQGHRLDGLGGHTFNMEIEPSGKRLFVIDSWEPTFDMPGFGNQIHILDIGDDGRVSAPKRGALVRMPVLNGTSSFGLAVVPREALTASDET